MDTKTYTIQEVSDRLGLHANTLRQWEMALGLEIPRDSKNQRRYADQVIDVLDSVKELRAIENGFATIRRKLNLTPPAEAPSQEPGSLPLNLLDSIRDEVQSVIVSNNQLARAYGEAQYRIGRLEAENETLKDHVKLLPTPIDHDRVQQENLRLKNQLERLENEVRKPWWQRVMGS